MATVTNSAPITKEVIDGNAYYSTVRRGVEYCAHFSEVVGAWYVSSQRLALGRRHIGGGKYFTKLEECKPFAALPALIAARAM